MIDEKFIHEQFTRLWDDIHSIREYMRLQFQHYDGCLMSIQNDKVRGKWVEEQERTESEVELLLVDMYNCGKDGRPVDFGLQAQVIRELAKKKVDEVMLCDAPYFAKENIKRKLDTM